MEGTSQPLFPMAIKKSNYRKCLGNNIKKKRHHLGWTQGDLAGRCGLYRSYLSHIESGTANPTLMVLVRIAAELDEDICALFCD
jgi:transcriptional regulator with XRE-family HTH domain